jgi:hypothetical protein
MLRAFLIAAFFAISCSAAENWTEVYTAPPSTPKPEVTPTPIPVTPSRRYYNSAYSTISSRLNYYVAQDIDQITPPVTAAIKVKIDSAGKLLSVSIDPSQSRSKRYNALVVKAATEAELPSFSKELKAEIGDTISCIFVFEQKLAEQDAAANP